MILLRFFIKYDVVNAEIPLDLKLCCSSFEIPPAPASKEQKNRVKPNVTSAEMSRSELPSELPQTCCLCEEPSSSRLGICAVELLCEVSCSGCICR